MQCCFETSVNYLSVDKLRNPRSLRSSKVAKFKNAYYEICHIYDDDVDDDDEGVDNDIVLELITSYADDEISYSDRSHPQYERKHVFFLSPRFVKASILGTFQNHILSAVLV
jgi:hypothetical protein